jgi:ubiquinone/menaquinone biosynthesis C-methylase UbiE
LVDAHCIARLRPHWASALRDANCERFGNVSEIWDSVAANWEENADFVDTHMASATDQLLGATEVSSGDVVLDLACGPGGAGLAAAGLVGESGKVVLADVAPAMVEVALRRATGLSQVSGAVFDQGSIGAADASFDAVLCRHGLMFAEEPVEAVREAVRVLRPGGHYGAITWDSRAANPWLGLILDAVGEQFGVVFPPPNIAGPFSLDDRDRLLAVLQDAGLVEVAVKALVTPMPAQSLEAWWDRVPELAGPLAQALAGMEPEVREEIRARALALGAEAARPTELGIELDGSVLIASARRP